MSPGAPRYPLRRKEATWQLLTQVPHEDVEHDKVKVPRRQTEEEAGYVRPPMTGQNFVPRVY